uniref:Uncharacterized protein n=1 Tax=Glossina brevipalpis TaxID=37001 RepID=A0A1A9W897_9MUSC
MELAQQHICNRCLKLAVTGRCLARNNAEICCQCCGAPPQEANLRERQKLEELKKPESICDPKLCTIFGKHDVDPYSLKVCEIKHKARKNDNYKSLGDPLGLIKSELNFRTDVDESEIEQIRFATYLIAFARFHLNPENTWNSNIIQEVLQNGLMLYSASQKYHFTQSSSRGIYSPEEDDMLREFEIQGHKFHVELMNIPLKTILYAMKRGGAGDSHTNNMLLVKNIKSVLEIILREKMYYLLRVKEFYLMIWHREGVFFVFDLCGRKISDLNSDKKEGVAMLLSLKTLDNVHHLIVNLSGLTKEERCTIRKLQIVKVITPSGEIRQREYERSLPNYEIINEDYGYVRGKLHLSLNPAELLRNRSALPAGVAALVVSKINHPATWSTKTVDRIICSAVNFCQTYWLKCSTSDPVDVEEFPTQFDIGQFRVHIDIFPKKYSGLWRCIPNHKFSDLAEAIKKAFDAGDSKLLLQINYQIYAIWKQNGYIYLFDPFRHRILGLYIQPYSVKHMGKYATLKMFRSFDVFMMTLNTLLLDSNRSSPFALHVMKIRHIRHKDKADYDEVPLISDGEVLSMNEVFCFEETDEMCKKLGVISDYEEDVSEKEELDLDSTSSESEILEENEASDLISIENVEDEEDEEDEEDDKIRAMKSTIIKIRSSIRLLPVNENTPKRELARLSKFELDKSIQKELPLEKKEQNRREVFDYQPPKYEELTDKVLKNVETKEEGFKDEIFKNEDFQNGVFKDELFKNERQESERLRTTIRIKSDKCEKFFNEAERFCLAPNANQYPGLRSRPVDMAVVGSESGSYDSLCKLICAGFRKADRIFVVTPWRNFVLFRYVTNNIKHYFLYNGCTCNVNRFRYLNLDMGTAGLACFREIGDMIKYIRLVRSKRFQNVRKTSEFNHIRREYCD